MYSAFLGIMRGFFPWLKKKQPEHEAENSLLYSAQHDIPTFTVYTVCPTRYQTRHFFNNSNTNENIATKFEQEYVRCVRNEKECVCSAPNCCDTEQQSASQPGSVVSGTHGI